MKKRTLLLSLIGMMTAFMLSAFTSQGINFTTTPAAIATTVPRQPMGLKVTASSPGKWRLEWQVDTNNSNNFMKIAGNAVYTLIGTDSLVISPYCYMNNYRYRCMASLDTLGATLVGYSDTVMLTVAGCMTPQNDTVDISVPVTLTIPDNAVINKYQWQQLIGRTWVNLPPSGDHINNSLLATQTSGGMYPRQFRCQLTTKGATTYYSDTVKLVAANWVSPGQNLTAVHDQAQFSITPSSGYQRVKWQVNENDDKCDDDEKYRLIDLNGDDSNAYKIATGAVNKLTIKKTLPGMNNNRYRALLLDTVTSNYLITNSSPLMITGNIDPSPFSLMGAIYSQPKGLSDDNTAALTQTYIRCSIPLSRRAIDGPKINAGWMDRTMWFRNLFIQLTYSTNAGTLNYVDSSGKTAYRDTIPRYKYVNRLDLYQYANLNINFMSPIITWIGGGAKRDNLCNVYVDPYFSFLHTNVTDSTTNNISVMSIVYGANVTVRFKPTANFQMELNARVFGLNPISPGINADYNYQYVRRNDYYKDTLHSTSLTTPNRPYFNFDGLIIYNTSATATNPSNLFLHYSVFSNLVKPQYKTQKNTFFQLQIGFAADLVKLGQGILKTILPAAATTSS